MKLELLVSTMHQKDMSLIDKMNIASDAIIINQSDTYDYQEINKDDHRIRMLTMQERGVGRSRNSALMRSDAAICVMADDDVEYVDDYEQIILNEFKRNPKADVIIFSVTIIDHNGKRTRKLEDGKRVRFYNALSYGAVRIAFRREKIVKNNIFFSLLFGGGARYGSGEDSIFLTDCLKKGLRVYTSSRKIADVHNHDSSWFTGYNEKFFHDKGALFQSIAPRISQGLAWQFAVRKYPSYKNEMTLSDAYRYMRQGIKEYQH